MSYTVMWMNEDGLFHNDPNGCVREIRGSFAAQEYFYYTAEGPCAGFCIIVFDNQVSQTERLDAARAVLHLMLLRKECL